jgi:tryptophan synthase beta chain
VAEAIRLAPTMAKTDVLMVNLSGRGDKDMGILARELDLKGSETAVRQAGEGTKG